MFFYTALNDDAHDARRREFDARFLARVEEIRRAEAEKASAARAAAANRIRKKRAATDST